MKGAYIYEIINMGHAILRNGMEPIWNIPQDAKTQNGHFKPTIHG